VRHCPASDKIGVYPTWTRAAKALRGIRRKGNKTNAQLPNHVYPCVCGNFHLTSQLSNTVRDRRDRERKRLRRERKHRW
jgi:hypothetical protein